MSFSERFADPSTGRSVVILRWDRTWQRVQAELPTGLLPDVTDVTMFEGPGLSVPTQGGDLVVRIDRSGVRPKFSATLSGRTLVSLAEDRLSAAASAELATVAKSPSGSSGRALLIGIGGLFAVFLLVTGSVVVMTRASSDPATTVVAQFPVVTALPNIFPTSIPILLPGQATPPALAPGATLPPPSGGSNGTGPVDDLTDSFLRERVLALGAANPDSAMQCISRLNVITEADVIEMRAPYRSSLYQCMPDELSRYWIVSATGLSPADEPCARRASVVGLGRLSLAELELIGASPNSTQFPLDIQDKQVAVVRELCPQIPGDVAERVVKE